MPDYDIVVIQVRELGTSLGKIKKVIKEKILNYSRADTVDVIQKSRIEEKEKKNI